MLHIIRVLVQDKEKNPVENADVIFLDPYGNGDDLLVVQTDKQGLADVKITDNSYIRVEKQGFEPQEKLYTGGYLIIHMQLEYAAAPPTPPPPPDDPGGRGQSGGGDGGGYNPPTAVIKVEGYVTDTNSTPIANAKLFNVSAKANINTTNLNPDTIDVPPVAITDSLGYYHAEITKAKNCLIAYADGYDMQKQCASTTQAGTQQIDFHLPLTVLTTGDPPNEDPPNDEPNEDDPLVVDDPDTPNTASLASSSNLLWILLAAFGIYALVKK